MTDAAAILATYSDFKLIKTRGVLQLIFEVDMSKMPEAFARLGYPTPGHENFVGIAKIDHKNLAGGTASNPGSAAVSVRLTQPPAKTGKGWAEYPLSQRAAILCGDEDFRDFLGQRLGYNALGADEGGDVECDAALKRHLHITSKRELDGGNPSATGNFGKMVGDFRAWQQAKGHGALQ